MTPWIALDSRSTELSVKTLKRTHLRPTPIQLLEVGAAYSPLPPSLLGLCDSTGQSRDYQNRPSQVLDS